MCRRVRRVGRMEFGADWGMGLTWFVCGKLNESWLVFLVFEDDVEDERIGGN